MDHILIRLAAQSAVLAALVCPVPPLCAAAPWEGQPVRHWNEQLTDSDISNRWYAAYVLGQLGPKAADAVPALHKILEDKSQDEYVRGTVAWALGRMIGPAAESEVPLLMETMHSRGHISVRRNSTEALGDLGPAAKRAVGELVSQLDDDDAVTRVQAAVALWKIERHAKAVPALLEMLRRGKSPAPYESAVALGRLGAEPDVVAAAAPALIEALRSGDADVRRAAARSLGQIGVAAFPALKTANALEDPNEETRRLVVESLGWMGPIAVKPLMSALTNESPAVRRAAARSLGRLGPEANAAEAALLTAVNDPVDDVRKEAARALRQVRGE